MEVPCIVGSGLRFEFLTPVGTRRKGDVNCSEKLLQILLGCKLMHDVIIVPFKDAPLASAWQTSVEVATPSLGIQRPPYR